MFDLYRRVIADGSVDDPDFVHQCWYILESQSDRIVFVREAIGSLGEDRIANLDCAAIDQANRVLPSPVCR